MANDLPWTDVGWVDLTMGGFLLLSVVGGLLRGLVYELMSLAGWFVAYLAVVWLVPVVLPFIHLGPDGSPLNHLVAVASVFMLSLLVWGLLARLVRALIRGTPLSGFDRLLGAAFGTVRGLLVLTVVALLVGLSPWASSPAWRQSRAVPWLEAAASRVEPWLPFEVHHPHPRGGTYVRHHRRDLQEPGQPVDL